MAASGATPIILYHSTTGSAVPSNANLAPGELAVNIADMKLYCENDSGVVTLLASAAGSAGDVVVQTRALRLLLQIRPATGIRIILRLAGTERQFQVLPRTLFATFLGPLSSLFMTAQHGRSMLR
jgi:hypothetical protein